MSYQASVYDAVYNAGRLVKEGHAQAVKIEGGSEVVEQIKAIVKASIPVMGHIGLTPNLLMPLVALRYKEKQKLLQKASRGCFSY